LKNLPDLRFGWKAWIAPVIVLGGTTVIACGFSKLYEEPRINMPLSSIWVFPFILFYEIFVGGDLGELGWGG
jgi:hypothetical protein